MPRPTTPAVISILLAQAAASPTPTNFLDGTWLGTEACVQHCNFNGPGGTFSPNSTQGTVEARLELLHGVGNYTVGGGNGPTSVVVPTEVREDSASGHIVDNDGSVHGTFVVQANASHLWGAWTSYGSKRLFQWEMSREALPCETITNRTLCTEQASPDQPRCAWDPKSGVCVSRVKQVDVFEANTVAPWGTKYSCFRVPSAVRTFTGEVLIFVESRIGSCGDQAPKDITMKVSKDNGTSWGPLTLVIGPTQHKSCAETSGCLDFSARNPYATVTKTGDVVLFFTNSTTSDHCVNYQVTLAASKNWLPVAPSSYVDMGSVEGVLAGPGAGIVLGSSSPWAGRMVGCGATGYVGGMPQTMPIWTSDDNGRSYHMSTGGGLPYVGLSECQVVELPNNSIMVNARNEIRNNNPLPKHRASAVSNDGGKTWGPPIFVEDLPEPTCMAGLINYDGLLYFSNPNTTSSRTHMTLKTSEDGLHWEVDTPIWAGPAAYSVLVPLCYEGRNCIGVVYERGDKSPYEKMTLAIVTTISTQK